MVIPVCKYTINCSIMLPVFLQLYLDMWLVFNLSSLVVFSHFDRTYMFCGGIKSYSVVRFLLARSLFITIYFVDDR
jgi:hypothetical protein